MSCGNAIPGGKQGLYKHMERCAYTFASLYLVRVCADFFVC